MSSLKVLNVQLQLTCLLQLVVLNVRVRTRILVRDKISFIQLQTQNKCKIVSGSTYVYELHQTDIWIRKSLASPTFSFHFSFCLLSIYIQEHQKQKDLVNMSQNSLTI